MDVHEISMNCKRTEFVGTAVLDTIGLCIAGVDDTLLKTMNIGTRYHALGLFSSRTGAAGQLTAMDEASSISAKPATWNLPIPPAREASLKKPSTPDAARPLVLWQAPPPLSVLSWQTPR